MNQLHIIAIATSMLQYTSFHLFSIVTTLALSPTPHTGGGGSGDGGLLSGTEQVVISVVVVSSVLLAVVVILVVAVVKLVQFVKTSKKFK